MDLPENISNELENYITRSKLIKRNQKIDYRLEKKRGYTVLIQTLDAIFENAHSETFEFKPTFQSYSNELPDVEEILKDEEFHNIDFKLFTKGKDGLFKHEKNIKWDFKNEIIILQKPIFLEFGDRIRMRIIQKTPKYASDNEVFTNNQFSENFELNVRFDPEDYIVGYRCIHPRLECMNVVNGNGEDNVNFNYPFLPSNGVIVWWRSPHNTSKP